MVTPVLPQGGNGFDEVYERMEEVFTSIGVPLFRDTYLGVFLLFVMGAAFAFFVWRLVARKV